MAFLGLHSVLWLRPTTTVCNGMVQKSLSSRCSATLVDRHPSRPTSCTPCMGFSAAGLGKIFGQGKWRARRCLAYLPGRSQSSSRQQAARLDENAASDGKRMRAPRRRRLSDIKVTWLGTSSGSPSPYRNVTCIGIRWVPGVSYLVDCGEGTVSQLEQANWDLLSLRAILITHAHGDHCFGLVGVLQAVDDAWTKCDADQIPAIMIVGPPELQALLETSLCYGILRLQSLKIEFKAMQLGRNEKNEVQQHALSDDQTMPGDIVPSKASDHLVSVDVPPDQADQIPIDLQSHWMEQYESGEERIVQPGLTWSLVLPGGACLSAAQLLHRAPCWGFVLREPGRIVESHAGETSEMVAVTVRPGRKVVILGDTANSSAMEVIARDADILSHEATFCLAMQTKAHMSTHSTAYAAGKFAARIDARQLVLTHFSARYELGQPLVSDDPEPDSTEGRLLPVDRPLAPSQVLLGEAWRGVAAGRQVVGSRRTMNVRMATDYSSVRVPLRGSRIIWTDSLEKVAMAVRDELRPPMWDETFWKGRQQQQAAHWPPASAGTLRARTAVSRLAERRARE